jgi:hypothetical protein
MAAHGGCGVSSTARFWWRLFATTVAVAGALLVPATASHAALVHLREQFEISGLNHACGTAIDSAGDVYVSSAGEVPPQIRIFDSGHTEVGSLTVSGEPCGLAVDGKGNLYVSDAANGKVLRYRPSAFPFSGTPAYEAPTTIDASGEARGIAVDPHDDRLYVAEGEHVAVYKPDGSFEVNVLEGEVTEASGVAAYTHIASQSNLGGRFERYIAVADPRGVEPDRLEIFSGQALYNGTTTTFSTPKLRKEIAGPREGEGFGFGPAGAYVAADPGNRSTTDKCTDEAGGQACTAGHFFVYDAAHDMVDEFEATGHFLDQFTDASLTDAEPTGLAVDRSGGPDDGTIYVSSGAGGGAKLLAFAPLPAPGRPELEEPLSHVLLNAAAVTTDSCGDVYVAAGPQIHIFDPEGTEVAKFEDVHKPVDLAVDSTGKLYVLDWDNGFASETRVTYYTPAPGTPCPASGTTYARHEPPVTTHEAFEPSPEPIWGVAVDPANDHLFVTGQSKTIEFDSAALGSGILNPCFACGLGLGTRQSIAVDGDTSSVYFGAIPGLLSIVDTGGTEILARFGGGGCPSGPFGATPRIAVDQGNGHVIEFQPGEGGREYEASGACVTEFGKSTSLARPYRIAVDSACALHDPPLTESTTPTCAEFDPSNGNVYVAFDDTAPETFDVTAFGPLSYGEPPEAVTEGASNVGEGKARLNGTVNPLHLAVEECHFEYLTEAEYQANIQTAEGEGHEDPVAEGFGFAGAETAACEAPGAAEIGTGNSPVAVHADIEGLDPEGTYRFRLVAKNKYGLGEGKALRLGPPSAVTKAALPVLYSEATLRGEVDPTGLATRYHFEYGAGEGEYSHSTPVEELSASAGRTEVEANLVGLEEGATYHFRVVAENEAGEAAGLDREFTTLARRTEPPCPNSAYRTGLSAKLPDCRAYELVTPAETNGLTPNAVTNGTIGAGFNDWLVTPRGQGAGERVSYFTSGTLPGFDGSGFLDGYRAERGPGEHPQAGWANSLFGPSYRQAVPDLTTNHILKQQGVSSDQLYSFWRVEPAEIFEGTLPRGAYLRVPDGAANPACNPEPSQLEFEAVGCGEGIDLEAENRYVSPGGAHVIFASKAHLESAAAPAGTAAIYDRPATSVSAEVVSTRPDGTSFGTGEDASYVGASEDGSSIAFRVGGTLYLHRGGKTTEVAPAPNAFAGLSEDGKRLFYANLADGSKPGTLYTFDAEAQHSTEIAENSIFLNVAPDGARVFFSKEEEGTPKLFAWDAETEATTFIAQLTDEDFERFGVPTGLPINLAVWTEVISAGNGIARPRSPTRSTPGGEVFVFQSHAQLTEYDNEGKGEIYRYDPAAEEGERLLCVSCDPSGAPASADAMLEAIETEGGVFETTVIANVTDDGGGVFFQSHDRLLPEDANNVQDVYEWQAKGTGGCQRNGGCLALISSGQGDADSYLYGMSADGRDVLFRTREKLVGADVAGSPSIYDAREGGGIPEPPQLEECQGDSCQGNGSAPPVLPAPATTGSGDGNEHRSHCARGKHRVKGHCVKKHSRARHHGRRHRRGRR